MGRILAAVISLVTWGLMAPSVQAACRWINGEYVCSDPNDQDCLTSTSYVMCDNPLANPPVYNNYSDVCTTTGGGSTGQVFYSCFDDVMWTGIPHESTQIHYTCCRTHTYTCDGPCGASSGGGGTWVGGSYTPCNDGETLTMDSSPAYECPRRARRGHFYLGPTDLIPLAVFIYTRMVPLPRKWTGRVNNQTTHSATWLAVNAGLPSESVSLVSATPGARKWVRIPNSAFSTLINSISAVNACMAMPYAPSIG